MKRVLPCAVLALSCWACSGGDSPSAAKVATTVQVTPGSVSFDAVGATQVVHGSVRDQKGGAMTGVPLAWASSSASATVVALAGDSALVTSSANGSASITATAGAATGSASVTVAQVPVTLQKVAGDLQSATIGGMLANQILVRVLDRLGAPVAGQAVTFTVTQGSGTLSSATVTSNVDGYASVSWTVGTDASVPQTVSVTVAGIASPLFFNATALLPAAGIAAVNAGNDQGAMAGTAVPVKPSVILKDASGNPIAGRTVTFTVTSGGGSVTGATTTTNASGVATVGNWTIGSTAGPNALTATVAGGSSVTNNPVVFRAIGCEGGGGSGYAITLCFTTTMTASQRAVFESAAARWSSVITADLADSGGEIPAGSCGANSPDLDIIIDDMVIFAGVEDIDGPGAILGSAGPCYIRDDATSLPVVGVMRFDVADVVQLEAANLLQAVFLHEMGHVLGIGSMWSYLGLLKNPSTVAGPALDTYFSGANGIAGFDAIGGTTYTGGQKVPVANTGGAGTVNSHWRENVLKNELMTGFIDTGSNPLSALTVRSLTDLGYTVNAAAADPFFLTLSLRADRSAAADAAPKGFRLENDVWTGPLYKINRQGRRTLLRR